MVVTPQLEKGRRGDRLGHDYRGQRGGDLQQMFHYRSSQSSEGAVAIRNVIRAY